MSSAYASGNPPDTSGCQWLAMTFRMQPNPPILYFLTLFYRFSVYRTYALLSLTLSWLPGSDETSTSTETTQPEGEKSMLLLLQQHHQFDALLAQRWRRRSLPNSPKTFTPQTHKLPSVRFFRHRLTARRITNVLFWHRIPFDHVRSTLIAGTQRVKKNIRTFGRGLQNTKGLSTGIIVSSFPWNFSNVFKNKCWKESFWDFFFPFRCNNDVVVFIF